MTSQAPATGEAVKIENFKDEKQDTRSVSPSATLPTPRDSNRTYGWIFSDPVTDSMTMVHTLVGFDHLDSWQNVRPTVLGATAKRTSGRLVPDDIVRPGEQ